MNSHNGSIGADFQINSYNTLTFSVMYNTWQRNSDNFTDYNALDEGMTLIDFFTRTSGNGMENQGMKVLRRRTR